MLITGVSVLSIVRYLQELWLAQHWNGLVQFPTSQSPHSWYSTVLIQHSSGPTMTYPTRIYPTLIQSSAQQQNDEQEQNNSNHCDY